MGEQKRYQLERANGQAPAVLVLTEEEAKRLGATPADTKPAPRGKARTAENK